LFADIESGYSIERGYLVHYRPGSGIRGFGRSSKTSTGHVGLVWGRYGAKMIILGLLLLILGFVFGISILWTIGIVLIVIGAVLWILGATGRKVGGRAHYY
jgi:hypothetical protein